MHFLKHRRIADRYLVVEYRDRNQFVVAVYQSQRRSLIRARKFATLREARDNFDEAVERYATSESEAAALAVLDAKRASYVPSNGATTPGWNWRGRAA